MKILVVSWHFWPILGGQAATAELIARYFLENGHEVQVLTHSLHNPEKHPGEFPFPVIRRPSRGQILSLFSWSDVVVTRHIALQLLWPLLVMRRPALVWYTGWLESSGGTGGRVRDWLRLRVMGRVVNVANSTAIAETLPRCDAVVHPGYDQTTFDNRVDWQDRDGDFIYFGRLDREKGVHLLLDALADLPGRRLTTIGDGGAVSDLQAQAERLGIADRVTFLGRQTPEQCDAHLNRHRVCVVPSEYDEPFGRVAVEALASGCRVIVADRGGLPDAAGPTGHCFRSGDSADLARVMDEVIALPEPAEAEIALREGHLRRNSFDAAVKRIVELIPTSGRPRAGRGLGNPSRGTS